MCAQKYQSSKNSCRRHSLSVLTANALVLVLRYTVHVNYEYDEPNVCSGHKLCMVLSKLRERKIADCSFPLVQTLRFTAHVKNR
jgi:hypothetical protein